MSRFDSDDDGGDYSYYQNEKRTRQFNEQDNVGGENDVEIRSHRQTNKKNLPDSPFIKLNTDLSYLL